LKNLEIERREASMGPPIYIGGNELEALGISVKPAQLQWGHRFTSVETRVLPDGRGVTARRFNGATDLHRWKRPLLQKYKDLLVPLQWGHRFTSVETKAIQEAATRQELLQWGHRFTSVETLTS